MGAQAKFVDKDISRNPWLYKYVTSNPQFLYAKYQSFLTQQLRTGSSAVNIDGGPRKNASGPTTRELRNLLF